MKRTSNEKNNSSKTKHSNRSTLGDEAVRAGEALRRGVISSAPKLTLNQEALHERIAKTAYELYLQRGQICGHDIDDWLEAERQVLAQLEVPLSPANVRKTRTRWKRSN